MATLKVSKPIQYLRSKTTIPGKDQQNKISEIQTALESYKITGRYFLLDLALGYMEDLYEMAKRESNGQ